MNRLAPAFGLRGQAQRDPALESGVAWFAREIAPSPLRSAGAVHDAWNLPNLL